MKYRYLVGIDEAGRGPLAGPMTLAAFCLPVEAQSVISKFPMKDSKKLTGSKREEIYKSLTKLKKENKVYFEITHMSNSVIDKKGLSKCLEIGIKKCLANLKISSKEARILLDGSLKAPMEFKDQKTIIKGDEKVKVIALASVIAKVSRDKIMLRLAKTYPGYGFEIHKGYGTKNHYLSLKKQGPSKVHRRSFLGLT